MPTSGWSARLSCNAQAQTNVGLAQAGWRNATLNGLFSAFGHHRFWLATALGLACANPALRHIPVARAAHAAVPKHWVYLVGLKLV
jgi:hypothetical protein